MRLIVKQPDDPFHSKMIKLFERVASPTIVESRLFAEKLKACLAERGLTLEVLHPYFVEAEPLFSYLSTRTDVICDDNNFPWLRKPEAIPIKDRTKPQAKLKSKYESPILTYPLDLLLLGTDHGVTKIVQPELGEDKNALEKLQKIFARVGSPSLAESFVAADMVKSRLEQKGWTVEVLRPLYAEAENFFEFLSSRMALLCDEEFAYLRPDYKPTPPRSESSVVFDESILGVAYRISDRHRMRQAEIQSQIKGILNVWRRDRNHNPGSDYRWIEDYSYQRTLKSGEIKTITVKGFWRAKPKKQGEI